MKIDFSQVLKDFDGGDLKTLKGQVSHICSRCGHTENKPKEVPLTLAKVCTDALGGTYPGEEISGEDRIKRFDLGMAIMAAKEPLFLDSDYRTLLKTLVQKAYPGPLVSGQAMGMIDPRPEPDELEPGSQE